MESMSKKFGNDITTCMFIVILSIMGYADVTNGQLISECNFDVLNFPKKILKFLP